MQIGGKARDLQRAHHSRLCRIGKIDRKQRVGLPEGHKICDIAVKPDGFDLLVLGQVFERAERFERCVQGVQAVVALILVFVGIDAVGVDLFRVVVHGRHDAEHALVFVHGELVQQMAVQRAVRELFDPALVEREEHKARSAAALCDLDILARLIRRNIARFRSPVACRKEHAVAAAIDAAAVTQHGLDLVDGVGLLHVDAAHDRVAVGKAAIRHIDVRNGDGLIAAVAPGRGRKAHGDALHHVPDILRRHEIQHAVHHARGEVVAALPERFLELRARRIGYVVEQH